MANKRNLIEYFCLYCLFIGIVYGNVPDINSQNYTNLPIVFNVADECIVEGNTNIATCPDKAWHVVRNVRLNETIIKNESIDLYSCYQLCLSDSSCVAITRQNSQKLSCTIFRENFRREFHTGYTSHFLTCCKLEKIKKSNLDFHNLPVVFNTQQNCLPQENKNLSTCKFKAFQLIERVYPYDYYKYLPVRNTFECMNLCLEEAGQCIAYYILIDEQRQTYCARYNKLDNVASKHHRWTYTFRQTCCNVNDKGLWLNLNQDLLMLYQPNTICKTFSFTNAGNCNWKFWHVEDELRLKGHYRETPFEWLQSCLNECLNDNGCFAVSVDWTGVKCLFFNTIEFTVELGQKGWTSYRLECCNDALNKTHENHDHSMKLENLPIIEDQSTQCKQTMRYANARTCAHKAWLVGDLQLLGPIKERHNVTLDECFHFCLLNPNCYSISVVNNSNNCSIFGENPSRNLTNSFKTYFLTCCLLKSNSALLK